MISCSVVGATGYTGIELIKLLSRHPDVTIAHLTTRSDEKINASSIVPGLSKTGDFFIEKKSNDEVAQDSDVVFLALPHTTAMDTAADFLKRKKIVIDLSADFRLKNIQDFKLWYGASHTQKKLLGKAVYGLPEIYRSKIREADLIANPGCYPTGTILGLFPLLKAKLIKEQSVIIDAKSGVSGAGKKLTVSSHFVEANENFTAYKINRHQHMPEIEQILSDVAKAQVGVTFVPHLLPLNRGLFSTIYAELKSNVKPAQVARAFETCYESEPFVRFLGEGISPAIRDVKKTNFCNIGIQVQPQAKRVIVMTAIDNLTKGASGQAVQNMNIRCGCPEEAGLL